MASSQGASSSGDSGGGRPPQEYTVRVSKGNNKKYMVMKFNQNAALDFTKVGSASLVRENNLKEYKLSNDLDQMPKFGAGSEYGRDMREEARRKKYGIMVKKYNPEDQPWHLKSGKGKEAKKFKGVKEGGILENASYYIFTQCADGAFEAFPVEEWYNFTPTIKYRYLNSEEAEEEFSRRDKILNHFTIMTKKRLKNDGVEADDEEDPDTKKKGKSKSKSKKDFLLTELDEWAQLSNEESEEDEDKEGSDTEKPKNKKVKTPKRTKGKKISRKRNSDDEALEDSDSVDEGQEVDYMTDTDSEDENMYAETADIKTKKYEEKGVDQEENSDEEEDEEEGEEKKEEQEEEEEEEGDKQKKESGSESSGSDSDSDPEKEVSQFSSALFMQAGSKKSKKFGDSSKSNSRSATPTSQVDGDTEKAKKRKPTDTADGASSAKKSKSEGTPTGSDGVTEEIIRKYLMRKPMTIKDLLQKLHKNTGIQKEKLSETIAPILRRIDPAKLKINDKLHLHIKNKKTS